MTEIVTSIHGNELGLGANRELIVRSGRIAGFSSSTYQPALAANGSTDDSAALQAAIEDCQTSKKTLVLPEGTIVASGLVISKPIRITGAGSNLTVIQAPDGATTPIFTFLRAGAASYFHEIAVLEQMTIKGVKDDVAGLNVAHGIRVEQGSETFCVRLDSLYITHNAGDGINGDTFNGWIEAHNCLIFDNKRNGVRAFTCYDWRFLGCDIGVAGGDTVYYYNSGNFVFNGTNIWSGGRYNFYAYADAGDASSGTVMMGGSLDRAQEHGLWFQLRNNGTLQLFGVRIAENSQKTYATYSGVYMSNQATDGLALIGCSFDRTASFGDGSSKEKYNLEWQATAAGYVLVVAPKCRGGRDLLTSANFTTQPTRTRIFGDGSMSGAINAGRTGVALDYQLGLPASTTTRAPINIPAGTAPSAPANGDMWTEGTDLKIRLNNTTYTITKT
jgi:hypothetical protein